MKNLSLSELSLYTIMLVACLAFATIAGAVDYGETESSETYDYHVIMVSYGDGIQCTVQSESFRWGSRGEHKLLIMERIFAMNNCGTTDTTATSMEVTADRVISITTRTLVEGETPGTSGTDCFIGTIE